MNTLAISDYSHVLYELERLKHQIPAWLDASERSQVQNAIQDLILQVRIQIQELHRDGAGHTEG